MRLDCVGRLHRKSEWFKVDEGSMVEGCRNGDIGSVGNQEIEPPFYDLL